MGALTETEAALLSLYFEETGAYHAKLRERMDSSSSPSSAGFDTVETLPD